MGSRMPNNMLRARIESYLRRKFASRADGIIEVKLEELATIMASYVHDETATREKLPLDLAASEEK